MTNEKILSICIPTYNRANPLSRLLENLDSELSGIHDLVEICISDNCSFDETEQVALDWQKKLPLIYSKALENRGFDRNVLRVIKMASGKYIWLMGDDDRIVKDSVKKLVSYLDNIDLGVVYLNEIFKNRWIPEFDFKDFRVFNKEELKIPLNISFIGVLCFNRLLVFDVIDNLIEEKEDRLYKKNFKDFVFDEFVHTYLFLECLSRHDYIGIAPLIGIEYIAGSESISYKKKFFLELLMLFYVLEIKKYYPWFRDDIKGKVNLKSYFARLAIVNECPSLESLYYTSYNALLKVLILEKKPIHFALVKFSQMSRNLFLLRWFWSILYKLLIQAKFCTRFNPEQEQREQGDVLTEKLAYLIQRIESLL